MPIRLSLRISGLSRFRQRLSGLARLLRQSSRDGLSIRIALPGRSTIESFVDRVGRHAAAELRSQVPVRTGLMKRRVSATGRLTVDVYSSATNSKGREYAPYVDGYHRALQSALRTAEHQISRKQFRVTYRSYFYSGSIYVNASRFVSARIEGHHLIIVGTASR